MAQESDAEDTLLRWVDTLTQTPVGEEDWRVRAGRPRARRPAAACSVAPGDRVQ